MIQKDNSFLKSVKGICAAIAILTLNGCGYTQFSKPSVTTADKVSITLPNGTRAELTNYRSEKSLLTDVAGEVTERGVSGAIKGVKP